MKIFISICLLTFFYNIGHCQNYGVTRGAAYRHDWNAQREHDIKEAELDRDAEARNSENIKEQYQKLQSLYKYQTSHSTPANTWVKVLATDGVNYITNCMVYVQDGTVTQLNNSNGTNLKIKSGGKIIEGKTMVSLEDSNAIVELYFDFKAQE